MATQAAEPKIELIYDDGEPLETYWHRQQMNLLAEVMDQGMLARGREDFFVGANTFIYYSLEQARRVATEPIETTRHFRGPDVFLVTGVEFRERNAWVVWEEDGRYPDLIFELLSPSTARIDRTVKKAIYERTFRTPEYFLYDREGDVLEGFGLVEGRYRQLEPDTNGRLPTRVLDGSFGRWSGSWMRRESTWIRLFDPDGELVPTYHEAARQVADAAKRNLDAAKRAAEAERRRADAAEAEAARLRARLEELGD